MAKKFSLKAVWYDKSGAVDRSIPIIVIPLFPDGSLLDRVAEFIEGKIEEQQYRAAVEKRLEQMINEVNGDEIPF